MEVHCIVGGVALIVVGVDALLGSESEYQQTLQYRSLEWLSELPRHERLLSCLALAWVVAVVVGIMWELSKGRLPAIAYVAVVVTLLVVWWAALPGLDHFMARTVQNDLNYSYVRKSGVVLVALGLALIIMGFIL
ncbi:MAG: hypothetical protein ACP5RN_02885 [Armatimonadota bacterium]